MKEATEVVKKAIAIIAPYLSVGTKSLDGVSKILWSEIKSVFKSRGDESIAIKFETSPFDQNLIGKMEYILEDEVRNNHAFKIILFELINNIIFSDENKNQIIQNGNQNISVTDIHNSTVKITNR